MKFKQALHPLLLCAALATVGGVHAQTSMATPAMTSAASPSRMQVKMERDEFLKTHVRDERSGEWKLRAGVEAPAGVKTRSEVTAARDEYLRTHRWDQSRGGWMPITGIERAPSNTTRAQMRSDTARFLSTHRWDEGTDTWIEKTPRASKG